MLSKKDEHKLVSHMYELWVLKSNPLFWNAQINGVIHYFNFFNLILFIWNLVAVFYFIFNVFACLYLICFNNKLQTRISTLIANQHQDWVFKLSSNYTVPMRGWCRWPHCNKMTGKARSRIYKLLNLGIFDLT